MELFRLFGTIAVRNEEANRNIEETTNNARDSSNEMQRSFGKVGTAFEKIGGVFGKIGTAFGNAFSNRSKVDEATKSLKELTETADAQETELAQLKQKYAELYTTQGKNSSEAKETAKQIQGLSNELKENRDKISAAEKAADNLDNSLDNTGNSAQKAANGGFTVLKGALANLVAEGLTRLLDGLKTLGSNAVAYQSQMEQYQTSFEVMTGSAEKAAEVTQKLGEVAASTPFELTDLADTTQLLMNYGFTADDAIDRMQMLGDISQGNADKMNSIATAYGQMSSAGKVSLEDIKQMIEAGFNPLQEISTTTGESMSSLYDRISKGTISVDEITASMQRSTAEGGKYFQSMDKQSQTLQGRLSTLGDTVNSSLGTVLSGILGKIADDLLPRLTSALENVDWESFGQKATEIFDAVMQGIDWVIAHKDIILAFIAGIGAGLAAAKIVGIITSVVTWIKNAGTAITVLQGVIAALGGPVTIIITVIAALVAAFIYLWNNCEGFRNFWINLWNGLKDAVSTAITAIGAFFTETIPAIFGAVIAFFQANWQGILLLLVNPFAGAFKLLYDNCEAFRTFINTLLENVKLLISTAWTAIKTTISTVVNAIRTVITTVWNAIKAFITTVMNGIRTVFTTVWNAIKTAITTVLNGIRTVVSTVWNAIKTAITTAMNGIRTVFTTVWNAIKTAISTVLGGIKTNVSTIWGNIKTSIETIVKGIKTTISTIFNAMKTAITTPLGAAKTSVSTIFGNIKTTISTIIGDAKDVVKKGLDAIKGFFSRLTLKFPKIKLPHFKITGKLSLDPPSVPKFGVDWYAKGGILNQPTAFGFNPATGRLQVGGEAGPEAVTPIDTLLGFVRTAVQEENAGLLDVMNRILAILAQYLPGIPDLNGLQIVMDTGAVAGALAPKMDSRLADISRLKERGR